MLYIVNTNLDTKKKLWIALTDIYGMGSHQSHQVCDVLGISGDRRVKQLSPLQIDHLATVITQNYTTGGDVKRITLQNISRLVKLASYRGFRHSQGLPVRGQRTHGNGRTRRKWNPTRIS